MANYHSDQPLESPDDDLFGRDQFATNIAKVILKQPLDEKYVIGLYSPWGDGKSSILNMIREPLEEEDAIVILFNPWIYSDLHSMTAGLLTEVAAKINDLELGYGEKQPTTPKDRIARWGKLNWKMARTRGMKNTVVGTIGSIAEVTSYSNSGVSIGKTIAGIARTVGKDSFITLKKNVEQNIKQLGKRIVVIIDDVDRLDKDEIFQLFKLVKAVADFKGITYVIALDDSAVAQALNSRFSSENNSQAGKDFLEKIIQIPLSLPYIPREELRDMFIKGVNALLSEYGLEVSDDDTNRFWDIFDKHIMPHLRTPRRVKRYLNLLTFTLPLAGNEMNITDVISLAGLQLLYPSTYKKIQNEKLLLTDSGYEFMADDGERQKENKKRFDSFVEDADEDAGAILTRLFPVINKTYGGSATWDDSSEKLQEAKRVASPDYFDRYFVFGIGKSDVADEEIIEILSLANPKQITASLKKIAKDVPTQRLIITKIKQYKHKVNKIDAFLLGLLGAADYLSNSQEAGFLSRSGLDVFAGLLFDVLKTQSKDKLQDASRLVRSCNDSELLTYFIRYINLDVQDEKENPVLTPSDFELFKKTAVHKIVTLAKTNRFYKLPKTASGLLYKYWQDYGNNTDARQHLQKALSTGDDVLDFLTSYLPTWHGSNGARRSDFGRASYDTINELIDTELLYQKILRDNPSLANIAKFVRFELIKDNPTINKVGNEGSAEFRAILAQQFSYIHKQSQTGELETTSDAEPKKET